jgi:hypothetical protein
MGDFIPKFNEGDAKQSLIRSQLAEEKLVGDVLIAFGTPIVSIGIMGAGDITATTLDLQDLDRIQPI